MWLNAISDFAIIEHVREGLWSSIWISNNHHNQLWPRYFRRQAGTYSKSLPHQLQTALFKELRGQHGQQKQKQTNKTGLSKVKWWLTQKFSARSLVEQCKALASTSPPSSHEIARISCFEHHSEYVLPTLWNLQWLLIEFNPLCI